ncbi:hypothetical protein H4R18_005612 [Coemansia javaensis]|uniref:Early meiotic induction protein 1 n=1 Tax=Coemansia javaensis TaxID=2761396 RepID=A0A9W8LD17_9FUNG|nr:hypothetical protein H4R18_005612 [Coemansia javaensis]
MADSTQDAPEERLPFDYYTCKASQAFDQWFACMTVGKQLSNYYRYGQRSGCGKHWSKFRLCMSMKVRSEEGARAMMKEFRDKEEAARRSKPSVLDVWTRRERAPEAEGAAHRVY